MKTLMKTALELAHREVEAERIVMILVPDSSWVILPPLAASFPNSRGAGYFRVSTCHSGLKMVAIDTLILVASSDPAWDSAGEALARERLRTSLHPLVIEVEDAAVVVSGVCFFCGKQNNPYSSENFRWVSVHSHAERCCMKCFPQHRERWIR